MKKKKIIKIKARLFDIDRELDRIEKHSDFLASQCADIFNEAKEGENMHDNPTVIKLNDLITGLSDRHNQLLDEWNQLFDKIK